MTYKQVVHIAIIILIVASITCNKDDNLMAQGISCNYRFTIESENIITQDFPPDCPTETSQNNGTYYRYHSPVFNPNNPSQIAYVRRNMLNSNSDGEALVLYTFDMCSGRTNVVQKDSLMSFSIDWGKNDWIVYRKWYENINKIRPDGTQDNKLVTTPFAFNLPNHLNIWNGSGTQLGWINGDLIYSYSGDKICGFTIVDTNGMATDTIRELCRLVPSGFPINIPNINMNPIDAGNWAWSKDDRKISCSAQAYVDYVYVYGLFYYDFTLDELVFVDNLSAQTWYGEVTDTDWMPDSQRLVWSTAKSIGYKDIHTGERKIILTAEGNHTYKSIDVSPDGKTIVVERINRVVVDGCTKIEHALYLVNSDGTDERRILLPE